MITPFVEAELVKVRNQSCRVPGGRGGVQMSSVWYGNRVYMTAIRFRCNSQTEVWVIPFTGQRSG